MPKISIMFYYRIKGERNNRPFQISFLVPEEGMPARLGLLLTLFLCMTNTMNTVTSETPQSSGEATAIVLWMIFCMVFILVALLEYAFILLYKRSFSKHKISHEKPEKKAAKENSKELSKMLDQTMLISCPIMFMFFCVVFWTVELNKA